MTTLDLKEFAKDVERLCDFILDKVSNEKARDGSEDIMVIERLKETAADIQFDRIQILSESLSGLAAYMKGASTP